MLNFEDDANKADSMEEEDINTLEESLISFQISGLNKDLSRKGEPINEPTSDEDSALQSPRMKLKRWGDMKGEGEERDAIVQHRSRHVKSE